MKRIVLFVLLIGVSLLSTSFRAKKSKKTSKAVSSRTVSRSLAYPVWGRNSSIESYWGDVRDGGRRRHEGIDIFAPKGTPVVAIADGVIEERGYTPRGGKILWLRTSGQPWSVYYAHLDKQTVREGQRVRKGQIIGTVGKTGNARTTPAHLHFGIYTWRGAVNPYPYVKYSPKVTTRPTKKAVKKTVKKSVKKSYRTKARR